MAGKNKPSDKRSRPDTDVSRTDRSKDRNETNNSNTRTGEINRGNTMNTGYTQQSDELHTKSGVTGSDADGQAE